MSACATVPSSRTIIQCPPLAQYSKDFYAKSSALLSKSSAEIQKLVDDYGKLRAACRTLSE